MALARLSLQTQPGLLFSPHTAYIRTFPQFVSFKNRRLGRSTALKSSIESSKSPIVNLGGDGEGDIDKITRRFEGSDAMEGGEKKDVAMEGGEKRGKTDVMGGRPLSSRALSLSILPASPPALGKSLLLFLLLPPLVPFHVLTSAKI